MKNKHIIICSVLGVLIVLALTYKIERIEEVCVKTGTSVRYNKYFSLFSSPKQYNVSWVEEALREEKMEVPEHQWRRTMGEARTLLTVINSHDKAPPTYFIRYISLSDMREEYGQAKILELAKAIATGNDSECGEAIQYINSQ